ncbi:phosphatidylinositol glycan anchor biosynthesis class S [Lycorma delicatula]|uniref:phosphatidylinositol glycan anchor biosynthesis class S n=1 Tax=Lycorma delicatula TaxID=130591 RepID=UPI003F518D1C
MHPKIPGQILLVEIKNSYKENEIIVGNYRTIYFVKGSVDKIGFVLKIWILQDNDLEETVTSVLTHRSTDVLTRSKRQERRVRASSSYDIIFTTISPQPEKVNILYDQEDSVVKFFQPLVSQLNLVAEHKLKSQWLYFIELGQHPKRDGKNNFVLTSDQLPHIISPLEKKLGSGVSKQPCLHFIIYTALCEESPLYFRTNDGLLVNAVLSPRWGGIQILNPEPVHCNGSQVLNTDISMFMSTFLAHLRSLIGITDQDFAIPKLTVLPLKSVKLRLWELDFLYRLRALEQISLAQMTLQSLSQLLKEISNIVINEEVGASVKNAVSHIGFGQEDLHSGNITGALYHAREAFDSAENAFTHPSLLALLYFPDDQKYAVYIPLFIPIMIPVLLSIRFITFYPKSLNLKRKKNN